MMKMLRAWWRRRAERRACFHHDHHTCEIWIWSTLVDLGRRKMFGCKRCGKAWII